MIMAIKQKIVAICDICGYMVDAVEMDEKDKSTWCSDDLNYNVPDTWAHGKEGIIDICPKCAKKLEKPEWNTRDSRERGFRYADARKK